MTQEDIIAMAREAGAEFAELPMGDAWVFPEEWQLQRFAALVCAAERSRQHDEIERLTNLCYEYLGELTALRAVKQTHDRMMDDALTIGSAWVRDGKRLEPTSVYKSMEDARDWLTSIGSEPE